MIFRRIGRSGLPTSIFSLGLWQTFGQTISEDAATAVVRAAYDGGINHIDGAEAYGRPRGAAEETVGRIIGRLGLDRDTLILTSKVSRAKFPEATRRGQHRKHIVEACEHALRRYQTDHLDVLYLHAPDAETPPEEQVWAMNLLIQQGKILYWATSNHSAQQVIDLCEAADRLRLIGPIMEQCIHSLLHRDVVERQLKPAIERAGIGIAAYTPLAGGILAGKYNDGRLPDDSRFATIARSHTELADWPHDIALSREVGAVAADLNVTQAQLALAWVAQQPNISTVLLGATRAEQITANLHALDVLPRLDGGVLARLEAACARRQALRQQTVCAKE